MDIAQKLALDSPEDAEYIVAKVSLLLNSFLCIILKYSFLIYF